MVLHSRVLVVIIEKKSAKRIFYSDRSHVDLDGFNSEALPFVGVKAKFETLSGLLLVFGLYAERLSLFIVSEDIDQVSH